MDQFICWAQRWLNGTISEERIKFRNDLRLVRADESSAGTQCHQRIAMVNSLLVSFLSFVSDRSPGRVKKQLLKFSVHLSGRACAGIHLIRLIQGQATDLMHNVTSI